MQKDARKTIKCRLKSILRNDVDYTTLFSCIKRANTITFICYSFIRSYVLYLYHKNEKIPSLNYDFIRMAFKSLSQKTCGPLPKGEQLITYNKLCKYYNNHFYKVLPYTDKFDSTNLSYIFQCLYETLINDSNESLISSLCSHIIRAYTVHQ